MRASDMGPGGREKRLTLRSIQGACSHKSFELGREYWEMYRVASLALQQDGTLTGTILQNDEDEDINMFGETIWGYVEGRPEEERRVVVSLRTGQRYCSCPYSQVGVCSHVAAVLICAVKDLRVTVPSGGLPVRPGSGKRTILPYRERADQILAQAAGTESAAEDMEEIMDLAVACRYEGDLAEMVMVILGASESLLSGLDYRAYSGHFHSLLETAPYPVSSCPEPKGMDAVRVREFGSMMKRLRPMLAYTRMPREQRMTCIAAAHRLYTMTVPWGPSKLYYGMVLWIAKDDEDWNFCRRLYDQLVPESTPDPRKDPVGFEAVMSLARTQAFLYSHFKDDSLLVSYARRYRDDPGTYARYVQYLRYERRLDEAYAVEAEGKRLFPDANMWDKWF